MRHAGNRHAIVGSKEGTLEVLDVGSGEVVSSVQAHKGAVWAVTLLPDSSGLISGSADHEAKVWEWEVRQYPLIFLASYVPPAHSSLQNLLDLTGLPFVCHWHQTLLLSNRKGFKENLQILCLLHALRALLHEETDHTTSKMPIECL